MFTRNSADTNIAFKHYSIYHRPGDNSAGMVHGGTALLVKSSIPHQEITLRTGLQAVAVRATCFKTVSICSVCLPPSLK